MEALTEGEYCLYWNPAVGSLMIITDEKTDKAMKDGEITMDKTADMLQLALQFATGCAEAHGATVRSPVARGRITRVRFDPTINWDEFVIVDHRDIPGPNQIAMIENDWPALATDQVHHKHEPVALIAHRSLRKLRQALAAVHVEIDLLPPVSDPRQPLTPDLIQYGPDNVFKRVEINKGDPGAVFDSDPGSLWERLIQRTELRIARSR